MIELAIICVCFCDKLGIKFIVCMKGFLGYRKINEWKCQLIHMLRISNSWFRKKIKFRYHFFCSFIYFFCINSSDFWAFHSHILLYVFNRKSNFYLCNKFKTKEIESIHKNQISIDKTIRRKRWKTKNNIFELWNHLLMVKCMCAFFACWFHRFILSFFSFHSQIFVQIYVFLYRTFQNHSFCSLSKLWVCLDFGFCFFSAFSCLSVCALPGKWEKSHARIQIATTSAHATIHKFGSIQLNNNSSSINANDEL